MTTLQNKILITLVALLGITHWSRAQSSFSLSGKILDERGDVLSGAYIEAFISSETSEPVTTVISDSLGGFHLSSEKEIKLIRVQYIGYERVLLNAPFSSPLTIRMKVMPLELDAVTVTGQRSTKITSGGIVFSPTQMQRVLPDVTHYLSQLPFVDKTGDGFSLIGRGSAVIYINNRRVEDLKELKELKMDDIQSVEVISNPGVIYDSDIKAVIKIKTKGKKSGVGVDVTSAVIHSELTEFWNRGSFSYNTPTLSLQSSLVYDYDPTRARLEIEQLMKTEHTSSVHYNSTEQQLYRNLRSRNSLVYTPNKSNSLGVSISYGHSTWDTDVVNGLRYSDNISSVEFEQKSHSISPSHKWTGNLF